MTRRTFLPALATPALAQQSRFAPNWASLDSRPAPAWYQDAKFGIFIHWGVYAVPSFANVGKYSEWYWNALTAGRSGKSNDPNQLATWEFHKRVYGADFPYRAFASMFKAELFKPEDWAETFRKSGAKYVALTSKHHDGFCLWGNEHANKSWERPWNALSIGPRRDVLGDLTNAVRAAGLRMGYYYSLYEWYNPIWLSDRKRYVAEHMAPQFQDLVNRYKPAIIFSDGEWDMPSADWHSEELLAWLYNESPCRDEVIVNDRWGKETRHHHGGYFTTEYTAGLQDASHPWEENRGMGRSYGYNRMERARDYRTAREMILMLVDLVSRGGNLLLDIGPAADGRIPELQEEKLLEIGEWLAVNGEAIYGTRPWTPPGQAKPRTRQWSAGRVPEFTASTYMSRYEIDDYIANPKPGGAAIEAFFTAKGSTVYAIVPGWPGSTVTLKDVRLGSNGGARLLGAGAPVRHRASGGDLVLDLPAVAPTGSHVQCAFAIRLDGVA
ncbi:MAG: alpha-L-fucosidase [Bryobacteraceae bacterium]